MRLLSKPVSLSKELESGIEELSLRKCYTFFRVKRVKGKGLNLGAEPPSIKLCCAYPLFREGTFTTS